MNLWIFNCKDVSYKVSQSMDRSLPLLDRMGIRFHIMMCDICARYRKQLLFLRNALRFNENREDEAEPVVPLPDDARARMKKRLAGGDDSSAA